MNNFGGFVVHEEQPQGCCRGCDKRTTGCHQTYRRYLLFRRICAAHARRRRREYEINDAEIRRFKRARDGHWEHIKHPKK